MEIDIVFCSFFSKPEIENGFFLELTRLSVLTYDMKNLSFFFTYPAIKNVYRKSRNQVNNLKEL